VSRAALRVLFYCHNVTGLGHVARSVRIAEALRGGAEVAIISGCRFLDRLDVHSDVLVERLPALLVDPAGRLRAAPGEPADAVELRATRILDFYRRWQPDAVVVDQRPMGLGGELMPTLEHAGAESWPARFVWGIPYLERAGAVVPKPRNPRILGALAAYDSAMVYDDESLDVRRAYGEYGLPDAVVHVGLVATPLPPPTPTTARRIVCLCGGGTGGAELFELAVEALAAANVEAAELRIVVGPFGDPERARALLDGAGRAEAEIWPTGTVDAATRDAALVIARCGYNTAAALIGSPLPTIFVPLHKREDEQIRRAERFAAFDGVWSVDDRESDAASRLASAIEAGIARGIAPRELPFDTGGAERAAAWLIERASRRRRREAS
jgi:predicted glycosyltransferase